MKFAYYPGCSLGSSAIEYHLSTKKAAEFLEIELIELEDWNCCGATSAHNTNKLLSLALPARNLAIAEDTGLDVLAPCAACYNRFRATEHSVREDAENKEKVQKAIDMEYSASNETVSVLELFAQKAGVDAIKQKVKKPLNGLKAVAYYGCLLVRPVSHTGFDDPEDPQTLDEIIKALGATSIDWSHKTECCSAALATSRPDVAAPMMYDILRAAKEAEADCIVTVCPLCVMNLDMRQKSIKNKYKLDYDIPVYYITELMAVAFGATPQEIKTDKHFVEAVKLLERLPLEDNSDMGDNNTDNKKTKQEAAASKDEDPEALQKKINAFKKGFEKNPEKMSARLIDDEERAKILAEVVTGDEKKVTKLAEFMASDNEKAKKAAEAYVTGEIKKRNK
ncbi:Heterodisulfide reductase subunit B-like protein / Domain of unknown function [Candidatus Syntrophocurvum alkaliphilum]|uniref:Cysteine-rich domain-containing protein n=1 Tax=Candidatus Syntrophocurvum alkaliphilum TaxID=2293317 RepID=A0A6I6DBU0_9FIRM|nr:CoB--CoM heterodisulfide reductase iron-sulfur subunit B family protein [Candidatus Syntrophocurvum alkaliphilum]QGT98855.1 Heterodisulfide reductase subunit B-like protein / Domain of unknown function [Candidatus Syntrophocurvum alkaliphilum]